MADSDGILKRTDRTNTGQFAKGNSGGPGRPKGLRNRTTLDARELRRRLIDSWDRVDGDAKLAELAESDFPTYLRTIANQLPKQDDPVSYAEWRERARVAIEEYAIERAQRTVTVVLAFLAVLQPKLRATMFQEITDGLNSSDMTEDDCRRMLADLETVIDPATLGLD